MVTAAGQIEGDHHLSRSSRTLGDLADVQVSSETCAHTHRRAWNDGQHLRAVALIIIIINVWEDAERVSAVTALPGLHAAQSEADAANLPTRGGIADLLPETPQNGTSSRIPVSPVSKRPSDNVRSTSGRQQDELADQELAS